MDFASEGDVTLKQKETPWTCQNVLSAKKSKKKMEARS